MDYVLHKINTARQLNPDYRVIDIGGTAGTGWSAGVANTIIDINAEDTETSMKIDICNPLDWERVKCMIDVFGLYDYAICTHTLEDIYNPIVTLKMLPFIAKEGIITMPSLRTELSNVESSFWLGYIHHRWMFDQVNGVMLIIPKIGMLESLAANKIQYKQDVEEIWFEWKWSPGYKLFMDNYLGPDSKTVVREYSKLIDGII
jgi:hypothetical protein